MSCKFVFELLECEICLMIFLIVEIVPVRIIEESSAGRSKCHYQQRVESTDTWVLLIDRSVFLASLEGAINALL